MTTSRAFSLLLHFPYSHVVFLEDGGQILLLVVIDLGQAEDQFGLGLGRLGLGDHLLQHIWWEEEERERKKEGGMMKVKEEGVQKKREKEI